MPPAPLRPKFKAAKAAKGDNSLRGLRGFIWSLFENVSEKGADGVRVNDWETIPRVAGMIVELSRQSCAHVNSI
jgi:hypothetical protein